MLVYFSGSTRNIENDIGIYRRIINAVREHGHIVARDWVETAYLQETRENKKAKLDWIDWSIVGEVEATLEGCDLVIAEASDTSTFGVGYEVSQALQRGKPTLLLVNKDADARSYAHGIKSKLVSYCTYDDDNLESLVGAFIEENTINTKDLRFNFVIDRQIHNHLRWRSYKTGKTKAEVVRDLLQRDMEDGQD
jgi:hypothetical protein